MPPRALPPQYTCADGRLHIEVANHTYTCYHSKQQIRIQLYASGWLHIGTIVCPACRDICEKEGMQCDADLVKASYVLAEKQFHKDMLYCRGAQYSASIILSGFVLLLLAVFR